MDSLCACKDEALIILTMKSKYVCLDTAEPQFGTELQQPVTGLGFSFGLLHYSQIQHSILICCLHNGLIL